MCLIAAGATSHPRSQMREIQVREACVSHYFFCLRLVTFAMRSNRQEPLVAIEVAEHWVRVAVVAERRVC